MSVLEAPLTKHRIGSLKPLHGLFAPVMSAGEILAEAPDTGLAPAVEEIEIPEHLTFKPSARPLAKVRSLADTISRDADLATAKTAHPTLLVRADPKQSGPKPTHLGPAREESDEPLPHTPRHAAILAADPVSPIADLFGKKQACESAVLTPNAEVITDVDPTEPVFLARINVELEPDDTDEDPRSREDLVRHRIAAVLNLHTVGEINSTWDQKLIDGTIKVGGRTYTVTLFRDGWDFTTVMIHPASPTESAKKIRAVINKVATALRTSGVRVLAIETQPHHDGEDEAI